MTEADWARLAEAKREAMRIAINLMRLAHKYDLVPKMDKIKITFDQWKIKVWATHPGVLFTKEDGSGLTYGDVGEWTAHVGPDMQADIRGVYTKDHASIWNDQDVDFDEYEPDGTAP